jgi:hypothetical protein
MSASYGLTLRQGQAFFQKKILPEQANKIIASHEWTKNDDRML